MLETSGEQTVQFLICVNDRHSPIFQPALLGAVLLLSPLASQHSWGGERSPRDAAQFQDLECIQDRGEVDFSPVEDPSIKLVFKAVPTPISKDFLCEMGTRSFDSGYHRSGRPFSCQSQVSERTENSESGQGEYVLVVSAPSENIDLRVWLERPTQELFGSSRFPATLQMNWEGKNGHPSVRSYSMICRLYLPPTI